MTERFVALDRLRALAVVSMVQGHTFTALMRPDALPSSVMQWHALVHGLTAPAFLFGAGLAFGIASYPRYASHHTLGASFWKRMQRYTLLIVIGYALQLPGASLLAAFKLRGDALAPVLRVGPLHLIAACLGVCQLMALAIRSPRLHATLCCAIGLAISIASPYVYSAELPVGPFVRPWLDASTGSLFPLFPWASFSFFGVAVGGALALRRELPRALVWIAPGFVLAATAYVLFLSGVRWSDPKWFWHASPLNTAFRVGLVLSLMGLLHLLAAREDGWTAMLARHSLVAYVVHLLLLYGTPFTPSLNYVYGLKLDAMQVTLVFAGVMGATMLAVWLWASGLKERGLSVPWVRAGLTVLGLFILTR
ncbi:MAG TPA: heparan-alpha-glucosaminide N-acetyltransferase domain-containing protein [Polyangiales bacterium]|nr:heparan-alpha-glucosaminide N-acetyltransferase domain-containing protein [Polyangiales bacterium]